LLLLISSTSTLARVPKLQLFANLIITQLPNKTYVKFDLSLPLANF